MANLKSMVDIEEIKKENKIAAPKGNVASEILKINEKKTRQIVIRLSESQFEKFSSINAKRGVSKTGILNVIINEYIEQYKDLLD